MPAVAEAEVMKVCNRCHEAKPLDSFCKSAATKDGRSGRCRLCHRHYSREWYRKNPQKSEVLQHYNQLYRERHPEKVAANSAVRNAVKTGQLDKADACEDCGAVLSAKEIDGHHEDYSKPLDVIWLCRGCHSKRHTKELV